jgi:ribonuclease BN (tRNA processing enzyme)
VELTVLGCSGSVPGPGEPASGYLLEAEGFLLAVDFGNGVLASLQTLRDPFDLGALLISHLHPDHCVDLTALTVLRRYHPSPPFDVSAHRLPVHAPSNAPQRFAAAYEATPVEDGKSVVLEVFDFHPITEQTIHIGPFEVTAALVAHPCEAYAFRIRHGGASLVYTGDSGPCRALDDLARGADVLLSEASWTDGPERPVGVHLSGTQAGALARRAGVGSLLLTHVPPWTDRNAVLAEARAEFGGPVEAVRRGAGYPVDRGGFGVSVGP